MVELLRFLADHCGFLFASGRFRFVDSLAQSPNGNAMILLESGALRLRFTRDRGKSFLEFQPIRGSRLIWFPLGLLRGVLLGDRGKSEVLDPSWATFIADSLDDLERRFSDPESTAQLILQLREQERLRAKDL